MTEFSPVAQSVLDAAYREMDYAPRRHVCCAAAAALRAAALEVVLPKYQYADWQMAHLIMQELQVIADELEGQ